jgi:glycine/D-amino acid oxidase-like deaminating enzyme
MAIQLLLAGKEIAVIDKPDANSATRVAAGLFNPITGKKFSKTWLADELFTYLHSFYKQAEELTGTDFFHPMPLYRPFISVEEQNEWMGKSTEPAYKDFIETSYTQPFLADQVHNPLGGILVKQCGYVDTIQFLSGVKEYVSKHALFFEEAYDEQELDLRESLVKYRTLTASKIIFCQGEQVKNNTIFSWLPVRPLKGETLSIKTTAKVDVVFNRGVYAVPTIWKVGATYEFKDLTPTVTQQAREELIEKLNELIKFSYEIVNQEWGFRPTTPDRRPIIGPHPEQPNAIIFNGLGTKGVSLAPYFSKVLTNWLENDTPINKEVDIQRYKPYYYAGNPLR